MNANIIFNNGGYIKPATRDGKPLFKDIESNRIRNRARLMYWYNKGIRRFIFRPYTAGLIGIDLDQKNGKDGIKEFIKITGQDPRDNYHVLTPSNGVHVYFFSDGQDYVSLELKPGLEIKSKAFITIAGSESNKGKYTPQGNPEKIISLPESLKKIIPIRSNTPAPIYTPRAGDNISLNKIYEVITKQGLTPAEGNRNNFSFQFARYARKQGHRPDEVISFLSFLNSADFTSREIQSAVNSAYRGANR